MNQREAVIFAMEANGGFATLGHLYESALAVDGVVWKTKTPFASIRRIVQDEKYFFKIKPGLYALNSRENDLPFQYTADTSTAEANSEFNHSYYQGLVVEIGNLQGKLTHVPPQDKNRLFLERPLKDVATVSKLFDFGYENMVNTARTVDVTWFNERQMPDTFIEVEHTTGIVNSLVKFVELQDYASSFWVVAPNVREQEFTSKSGKAAFGDLGNRLTFVSYDKISQLHANLFERKYKIGL